MSIVSRKEVYDKMVENSAISWYQEWQKERAKRIEAEAKYERLTRKIKDNALKEVAERDIEPNGKLQKVADWNDDPRTITNQDRDYFEAILEMARDEGEWIE